MASFRSKCLIMLENRFPDADRDELNHFFEIVKGYVEGKRKSLALDDLKTEDLNFIERFKEQTLRSKLLQKHDQLIRLQLVPKMVDQAMLHPTDPFEGFIAMLVRGVDTFKGAGMAIEAQIHSKMSRWLSQLGRKMFANPAYMKILANRENYRDIFVEVYKTFGDNVKRQGDVPITPIPKEISEIAKIIREMADLQNDALNKAGGNAKVTPAKALGLHFDQSEIRARSSEEFYKDFFGKNSFLDVEATLENMGFVGMSRSAKAKFMRDISDELYENLSQGRHLSSLIDQRIEGNNTLDFVFVNHDNFKLRTSKLDYLVFKDADSHWKALDKYGTGQGDIMNGLLHSIQKNSRAVGIMENMGGNPVVFLKEALAMLEDRVRKEPRFKNVDQKHWLKRIGAKLYGMDQKHYDEIMDRFRSHGARGLPREIEWILDELTGENKVPQNPSIHNLFSALRLVQFMAKLGNSVIRAIGGDTVTMAATARYQTGQSFLGQVYEQGMNFLDIAIKNRSNSAFSKEENLRRFASVYGVMPRSFITDSMQRLGATSVARGLLGKMQHIYLKFNLLQWSTESAKLSFSHAQAHYFGIMADTPLEKLDANTQNLFNLYDISSDDWDFLRKHAIEGIDGKAYIMPDLIDNLSDDIIKSHIISKMDSPSILLTESKKKTVAKRDKSGDILDKVQDSEFKVGENVEVAPEEIPREVSKREIDKFRENLVNKWVTMFTDQNDSAVVMPGARERAFTEGTRFGLTPGTIVQELWQSAWLFKSFPITMFTKNVMRDLRQPGGLAEVAKFMAGMTVAGTMSQMAIDAAAGKTMRKDWDPTTEKGRTNIADMLVAGGAMGIFTDILVGAANSDKELAPFLFDAAAGPVISEVLDGFSAANAAMSSDPNFIKGLKWIQSNFPGGNLFYTKSVLNYFLWYNLQEQAEPGHVRKVERRLKKRTGQKFTVK